MVKTFVWCWPSTIPTCGLYGNSPSKFPSGGIPPNDPPFSDPPLYEFLGDHAFDNYRKGFLSTN